MGKSFPHGRIRKINRGTKYQGLQNDISIYLHKILHMKKMIIAGLLGLMIAVSGFSQQEKYIKAMENTLSIFQQANTNDELQALSAKFERIGQAEKTQWLPFYYAGMIQSRLSMMKAGNPESLADEAAKFAAIADSLQPGNSEVYCLKSMVASARMMVDPMNRWMTFGQESSKYLQMAKKADSTNPRPFVLEAIALKSTPEQFGGGCQKSKPVALKALDMFVLFTPSSSIHPKWGKDILEGILSACK